MSADEPSVEILVLPVDLDSSGHVLDTPTKNVVIVLPASMSIAISQYDIELYGISAEQISGNILDLSGVYGSLEAFFNNTDGSACLIEYQQTNANATKSTIADELGLYRDDLHCRTDSSPNNTSSGLGELAKKENANDLIVALKVALGSNNKLGDISGQVNVSHTYSNMMANDTQYDRDLDFGDFMVSYVAHELFGHAQATAPIENDQAIHDYFCKDDVSDVNIALLTVPPKDDVDNGAQVASRLVKMLYSAGEPELQKVVEMVLLQAPERFRKQDQKDKWCPLVWKDGDVVYFRVQTEKFTEINMFRDKRGEAAGVISSQVPEAHVSTSAAGTEAESLAMQAQNGQATGSSNLSVSSRNLFLRVVLRAKKA